MQVALNYGTDGKSMKGSVLFKIVALNDLEMGASIQFLSAFPQEEEVYLMLLLTGTCTS
jgi:hypothetical protein